MKPAPVIGSTIEGLIETGRTRNTYAGYITILGAGDEKIGRINTEKAVLVLIVHGVESE